MTLHTPVWVQPVGGDPSFPNGIPFSAQELRRSMQAMMSIGPSAPAASQQGVSPLDGQFVVAQRGAGANFSVDVASGFAWVQGDDVTAQGVYQCWNDGTVNVATPSAPGTGTEVHRLVIQIEDKLNNGTWTGYTANLVLMPDTGSGTPAEPASAMTLALISISAGQASVLNANISDQRPLLFKPNVPLTTGSGGASSTAEVVIGTFTSAIPANVPAGQRYDVRASGSCADGTLSQTVTFRARLDSVSGQALFNSAISPGATGTRLWNFSMSFQVATAGASGLLSGGGFFGSNIDNQIYALLVNATSVNLTAPHSLVVTAQYSASNGSNLAATVAGSATPA